MNTIEIKNLEDEILFTHTADDNTFLDTLKNGIRDGVDLRNADFRGANLRYASLRGADLRGADLRYARLRDTSLKGADLRGAKLRGANYTKEQIDSAITDETTIF